MEKPEFNKKTQSTSKLDLNLRTRLLKCYIWSTALCGAERWTLRKVDQKCVGSSDMWCRGRTEKISRTDRVRNDEVLHRIKEERNILHTVKRRKANWIGHILRGNCLLQHIIERKDETGSQGRRHKQLPYATYLCKEPVILVRREFCRQSFEKKLKHQISSKSVQ
jgi:hypothetical protein